VGKTWYRLYCKALWVHSMLFASSEGCYGLIYKVLIVQCNDIFFLKEMLQFDVMQICHVNIQQILTTSNWLEILSSFASNTSFIYCSFGSLKNVLEY
jgi:hypothetical protein